MDFHTQEILRVFNSHLRIKKLITAFCYFFIAAGILIYVFHAFSQSQTIKVVNKYKDKDVGEIEKVMTNPHVKIQHSADNIYDVRAKKAVHKDGEEAMLYDVFATGKIGQISAGELEVKDGGDHLIFSKNPVLILNKTSN